MKTRFVRTLLTGPAIAGVMAGLAAGTDAGTATPSLTCPLTRSLQIIWL